MKTITQTSNPYRLKRTRADWKLFGHAPTANRIGHNLLAVALAVVAGLASSARATVINVNVGNAGSANALNGTAYMTGGYAQAPVSYLGATWTDVSTAPNYTITNLPDSQANATAVGFATISPTAMQGPTLWSDHPNVKLLQGGINRAFNSSSGNTMTKRFQLTGLTPGNLYHIVVVGCQQDKAAGEWGIGTTSTGPSAGTTKTIINPGYINEFWMDGQNYAIFYRVAADSGGNIFVWGKGQPGTGGYANGLVLNGIQLLTADELQSPENNMLSLTVPGGASVFSDTSVTLYVPTGTSLTALVPTITVSSGATVSPASGVANDFSVPQTYTVTAQNGATKQYIVTAQILDPTGKVYVNMDNIARSGFSGPAGDSGATWTERVGFTAGASASGLVDSVGFPSSVGYTTTGVDGLDGWGSPALAVLSAGLRQFNTSSNNAQSLTINGLTPGAKYNVWLASANCANVGASSNQRGYGVWNTPNATPTGGDHVVDNRTTQIGDQWVEGNNYVYFAKVTADANGKIVFNGRSIPDAPTYDVRLPLNGFQVEPATAASTACSILTFGPGAVIDQNAATIAWTVPYGTDLAALAPTFTLSALATCNQTSGTAPTPNFSTGPVHYIVTAEDGTTTRDYTVTVTINTPPILFGASGSGTLSFDTLPDVTAWSTVVITGNGGTAVDPAGLDTLVNTLTATGISSQLGTVFADPAGTTTQLGQWNATDLRLTSRAGTSAATPFLATVKNVSGAALEQLDIRFTLTGQEPSAGEDTGLAGYALYYSLTGAKADWHRIGSYSAPGSVTVPNIILNAPWAAGAMLYVLWVDDNGNAGGDGWWGFDDVSFTPSVPLPAPIGLSAIPSDAQATLAWTKYVGATSYNVKRSTTSGSGYVTVGTPSTNFFADSPLVNGTTYYYVVSAVTNSVQTGNSAEVSVVPQPVDAGLSTVVAFAPAVWADGSALSTITVTLVNGLGSPKSGKTVTLASDRGAADTISAASGPSDANGVVTFKVKSSTAGYAVFTATDTTDSTPITQTATVAFTTKPPPVTTYVPGSTIVQEWNFTNSQQLGWSLSRRYSLTDAGIQLGAPTPVVGDHGAMVGLMRGNAPAAWTYSNIGVEMTYYAPNLPPPTDGYEFLYLWTDSSPRDGFGVLSSGGGAGNTLRRSAFTQQQQAGNTTWPAVPLDPILGTGLDGLHTMALVSKADGTINTYLDGVLVNTQAGVPMTTAPQYISIGYNVNGNMYMPFGSLISQVRAFNAPDVVPPPDLGFVRNADGTFTLTWTGATLLQATNVMGPWTTNTTAISPLTVTPDKAVQQMFYRLQVP